MSTDDVFQRACRVAALASLASNGVIAALIDGPESAADLSVRLGLHAGALERALNTLVAMGLLDEQEGVYAVDAVVRQQADRGPAPLWAVLALLQGLPEHLRTGDALAVDRDDRSALYAGATPGLGRMFAPAAHRLAGLLPPASTILDVGAGSGVWSLAMARAHPGSEVTALDLGPVLGAFIDAAAGVPHRTVAGDFHDAEPGGPFDRVVLANVLHLESPDAARRLVGRGAGWTRPGGEVVVVDTLLHTEDSALAVSSYALHLGLRIQGGQVYGAETIAGWGAEAGLREVARHGLDPARGLGALVLRSAP